MADIQLTKVRILSKEDLTAKTGGAHFHVFIKEDDGSELLVRTTVEQHNLQNGVGGYAHNPVPPKGYKWRATIGMNEYDTPDGLLGVNQYAVDGDVAIVRIEGMKDGYAKTIPAALVKNDTIASEELALPFKVLDAEAKADVAIETKP